MLSEGAPCMKVTEGNARKGRKMHALEAQPTGCSTDSQTNIQLDPRFKKIEGFSITEYDLYVNNGILIRLKAVPGYDNAYIEDKKQTTYELYTRPTLQYALKCDKDVMSRKDAANLLAFDFTDEDTASSLSLSSIVLTVMCLIVGIYVLVQNKNKRFNAAKNANILRSIAILVIVFLCFGYLSD